MKQLGQLVLILMIFGLAVGQNQTNCNTYAVEVCNDHNSDVWSIQRSTCNAKFGNIAGNEDDLGLLMTKSLKQSFQFIIMVNLQ